MVKIENNTFTGLPVTLVHEILEKSGQIAHEIYEPFRDIQDKRDELRARLYEHDIIQSDSITESLKTVSTCGIDGSYAVEKFLTSNLVYCAACAVEGLLPPSGERHWLIPSHKTLFNVEKQHAHSVKILRAVMMEMEIELAASAPQRIILFNGSFITPFLTIMETLKLAFDTEESVTSKEFIHRFKPSILSLKTISDSDTTEKMWVGIPRNMSINELSKNLNLPQYFDDEVLFTILLSPGEFTKPFPVDQSELSWVKNLPVNDQNFAAVKDSLVSAFNKLHFMYYRPYEWTPVLRIEIAHPIAQDITTCALILNTIKYQCSTTVVKVPYPLHYAGKMAHSIKKAMSTLRTLSVSHITNSHKNDIGEMFSLFLFNDLHKVEYNE
ncbi:MAG TPA: DNA double-strand break repair nuclease NurA [Anaerolineae bacterium]|nr:DNA double-strand break repair nuclease NurA [Anaerolineae bacterium]